MTSLNSTIETAWINQFTDDVYDLTIQNQARLRPVVSKIVPLKGEKLFFSRVGSTEVQVINQRHQRIVPNDLAWDRRCLTTERVGVPFYLDSRDELKILQEPKSVYARRAAEAMERDFDRMVIACLDAAVLTGKAGTTSVSAATDGMQTVTATSGFTYDTLLEIDANWAKYEIGTQKPCKKYLLISEQEHLQLMKEAELISGDFTHQYVVEKGEIKTALGMEIIQYGSAVPNPMLAVSGGQRTCWAITGDCVIVGMPKQWDTKWKDLAEIWTTNQLTVEGERGAIVMERSHVQKITTTAT